MENEFDFKKWEVPELSNERAQELLVAAGRKAAHRRSVRRKIKVGTAVLAGVAAIAVGYLNYINSYSYKVATVERLLDLEIQKSSKTYLNGRDYQEGRERMEHHESPI